jgi:hypothetical protein
MYDIPPALLAGIASRESRLGWILKTNGFGDDGGFGIMQISAIHNPDTNLAPDSLDHVSPDMLTV